MSRSIAGVGRGITVAVVLVATACGRGSEEAGSSPAPEPLEASYSVDDAREVADALTADLKSRLVREMGAGGPAAAVRVCSEVAQEVAASHSDDRVTVRRVSLKTRNPSNRPDDWERAELERMEREGLPPQGEIIELVDGPDGEVLRYLRPIRTVSVCLTCHGPADALDPEVAGILAERYPEDRAVDYEAGDLRGAVSVTIRP